MDWAALADLPVRTRRGGRVESGDRRVRARQPAGDEDRPAGAEEEDVKVEVTDGYLTISGERKREEEEKKDDFYRCEREYGSFYRAVPLPEGAKLEDVKATFAGGVLEVSVPLPAKAEATVRTVAIEEPAKAKAA
jgi:hypothetical protein